jgi:alkanesulfonate monooxygenase SsuD/methylene tetrahydromethanopterin reductase-like flavin-dependent oxidoreductase (luciferase family)
MIGGGGEKLLLRIVARHADRWNFGGSVEEFRTKLPILESHCRAVGRDFGSIEKSWFGNVLIEPTDADLQERLRKRAARSTATPAFDLRGITGTPDTIATKIEEYAALGVTHFIAMFGRVDRLGATELFAKEVMPRFR